MKNIVDSESVFAFLTRINLHLNKPRTVPELVEVSKDWIQACEDWKVTPEKFERAANYMLTHCRTFPLLDDFLHALDETWQQVTHDYPALEGPESEPQHLTREQIERNKKGIRLLLDVIDHKISLEEALSQFSESVQSVSPPTSEGKMTCCFKGRPLIPAKKTIEEILGDDEDLFQRHYEAWQKHEGQQSRLHRLFSEREVSRVKEINQELLDNGYRVMGISPMDKLEWGLVTECHSLV